MRTECVTSEDVGSRLKKARELRGIHIGEVSEVLGVSESVIAEIEAGSIESNYMAILAMIYFYSESVHTIFSNFFKYNDRQVYFLRNKSDAEAEYIREYILDFIRLQQEAQGRFSPLVPVFTKQNTSARPKKIVSSVLEARAQDLLRKCSDYKLPVNVYEIAARLSILVAFESLPSKLYNLRGFCYEESSFKLIGINKIHPIELQRFTVAHELHHLIYDSVSTFCSSDNEEEVIEENAERFAAELLMPSTSIQRLIAHPPNVSYLTIHLVAEHFKVSYQAAAIRLQTFGLIPSATDVCKSEYRKKDKEKTKFLLKNKLKYLNAVFGLETGISELQIDSVEKHSLCGAPILDPTHQFCWSCGLKIKDTKSKDGINLHYQQSPSNLSPRKFISMDKNKDYSQLSFNLRVN